jgi:hypothetical protein
MRRSRDRIKRAEAPGSKDGWLFNCDMNVTILHYR